MQFRKMKKVEAIVLEATSPNNDNTSRYANFSLKVRLLLEDFEHRTANIEGFLLWKVKPNDKIKVLIDAENIEQSKMFTADEIIMSWILIVVCTIYLTFLIFGYSWH